MNARDSARIQARHSRLKMSKIPKQVRAAVESRDRGLWERPNAGRAYTMSPTAEETLPFG